jgi:hypothetical protein
MESLLLLVERLKKKRQQPVPEQLQHWSFEEIQSAIDLIYETFPPVSVRHYPRTYSLLCALLQERSRRTPFAEESDCELDYQLEAGEYGLWHLTLPATMWSDTTPAGAATSQDRVTLCSVAFAAAAAGGGAAVGGTSNTAR